MDREISKRIGQKSPDRINTVPQPTARYFFFFQETARRFFHHLTHKVLVGL